MRKHLQREERELAKSGAGQSLNESSLQEHDYAQDAASSAMGTPGEATPTLSNSVEAKVDDLINETEKEHDIERQMDHQVHHHESESHTETDTTHTSDLGSVDYEEKKINEVIDQQIVSQLDNLEVGDKKDNEENEDGRDSPVVVKKPLYIPDAKPQRTKKEKRKAREAAKRALENTVPITLVSEIQLVELSDFACSTVMSVTSHLVHVQSSSIIVSFFCLLIVKLNDPI